MSYKADDLEVVSVMNKWEGHWEWSVDELFYHPGADKFFMHGEAGCSCNFYEGPSGPLDGFVLWSKEEALRNLDGDFSLAVRNFSYSEYGEETDGE